MIDWLANSLFWVTDGELLINSPLLFLWIFVWSAPIAVLLAYGIGSRYGPGLMALCVIGFLPVLVLIFAPPFAQIEMMQECESVTVEVSTEKVKDQQIQMTQCRYKENFYDADFGEWKLYQISR
jgi:hypothetical protein